MKPFLIAVLAAAGLATCACSASNSGGQPSATGPASSPSATQSPTAHSTTTTSAQPSASPSTTPAGVAACLSRYLHGSVGSSQGTAGAVEVTIVFKNLNNAPCTLYGYPGVALAAGTPVTDIGQPSTENPATARELVTLPPGGYASAILQISDAGNYPATKCHPVAADWLAVIPPNQRIPLYIHYNSTACKGKVKLLSVTAVRSGNSG